MTCPPSGLPEEKQANTRFFLTLLTLYILPITLYSGSEVSVDMRGETDPMAEGIAALQGMHQDPVAQKDRSVRAA